MIARRPNSRVAMGASPARGMMRPTPLLAVSPQQLMLEFQAVQRLFVADEPCCFFDFASIDKMRQESNGTVAAAVGAPIGFLPDISKSRDPKTHAISGTNIYQTEGLLYNHPAALLVAPYGTKLPSDEEWFTLENFLKDSGQTCNASRSGAYDCFTAGAKLKEGGSSGVNLPLAGYRTSGGTFGSRGSYASFWSSSVSGTNAWDRYLIGGSSGVGRLPDSQAYGFSVRCLVDSVVLPDFVAGSTITDARDGQTYGTVQVGTQIWLTSNCRYFGANVPICSAQQGSLTLPMAYVYGFSQNA